MKKYKYWVIFLIIALVMTILWCATIFIVPFFVENYYPDPCRTPPTFGEIGDMFGAVNAIFSGLAFSGIIVSLWLQKEDFNNTKKEILTERFVNLVFLQSEKIQHSINSLIVGRTDDRVDGEIGLGRVNIGISDSIKNNSSNNLTAFITTIDGNIDGNIDGLAPIYFHIGNSFSIIERFAKDNKIGDDLKSEYILIFIQNLGYNLLKNSQLLSKIKENVDAKILNEMESTNEPKVRRFLAEKKYTILWDNVAKINEHRILKDI